MNKNINYSYFRLKIWSHFMKHVSFAIKSQKNKWRNTADSDPFPTIFCPIRQQE